MGANPTTLKLGIKPVEQNPRITVKVSGEFSPVPASTPDPEPTEESNRAYFRGIVPAQEIAHIEVSAIPQHVDFSRYNSDDSMAPYVEWFARYLQKSPTLSEDKKCALYGAYHDYKQGSATVDKEALRPLVNAVTRQLSADQALLHQSINKTAGVPLFKPRDKEFETYPPNTAFVLSGGSQNKTVFGDTFIATLLEPSGRKDSMTDAVRFVATQARSLRIANGKDANQVVYEMPVAYINEAMEPFFPKNQTQGKRFVIYIDGPLHDQQEVDEAKKRYKDFEEKIKSESDPTGDAELEINHLIEPSLKQVDAAIADVAKVAGPNDEVLVVLSAHGNNSMFPPPLKPDELVLEGSKLGYVSINKDEMYTDEELKCSLSALNKCKAVGVLVRACYGGAWVEEPREVQTIERAVTFPIPKAKAVK